MGVLACEEAVIYLDEVLLIWGVGNESIGANESAQNVFLQELLDAGAKLLGSAPVRIPGALNLAMDSILFMCEKLAGSLPRMELDRPAYYRMVVNELLGRKKQGLDIGAGAAGLRQALSREAPGLRWRVMADLHTREGVGAAWRTAKQLIGREDSASDITVLHGSEHGFRNIFECAQRLADFAGTSRNSGLQKSEAVAADGIPSGR
jgi:hypothetical protein